MKLRNWIVLLLACCTAATFVGCGNESQTPPAKNPSLSLAVQVETLTEGESNAFVATAVDVDTKLVYEIAKDGGEYKAYKTSAATTVAYRSTEAGSFSVRVKTEDGALVSNVCSFTVVEYGGDTFGKSVNGESPTANVDLSADRGENATLEHKAVNAVTEEYAFVKGFSADSFYFTTDVDIVTNNGGDAHPKTGIFCKAGTTFYYFAFDVKPHMTGDEVVFVNSTASGWGWPGTVFHEAPSFRNGATRVKNTMGMLRKKGTFYLFINAECIGKVEARGLIAASTVGTFTMGQNAIYSDYACHAEGSEAYTAALKKAEEVWG